ncbi:PilN domain-containing protein [Gallaecimonas sp. GXIMD4217]|uniref:PilN domain-containing protein n=1 Tax=Gallaecimonas sp. GXIMD4217 TaxID=3131927 RepID=UPI00311AF4C1
MTATARPNSLTKLADLALAFWRWWSGQLLALIPQGWLKARRSPAVIIEYRDGDLYWVSAAGKTLLQGQAGQLAESNRQQLKQQAARAGDILLLLPPDKVLSKPLSLPLATQDRLRDVLAFEMSRHTPFQAEQVHFGYQITGKDQGKLKIELLVVSRAFLEPIQAELSRLELQATQLSVDGPKGVTVIDLKDHQQGGGHGALAVKLVLGLAVLAALMVAPLWLRQQQIAELQGRLAGPQAAAERARASQEQIELLTEGASTLVRRKQQEQSPLVTLNELTLLLPDNTWANRLEIKGDQIKLMGESGNASALIGLVESSPLFEDASFASPVTINPRTQKERFSLSARINNGEAQP